MGHDTIGNFLKRLHYYDSTHADATFTSTEEESDDDRDLSIEDFSSVGAWCKYKRQVSKMNDRMRRLGESYDKIKIFSILMLISSIIFSGLWASIPVVLIFLYTVVLKAPSREARIDVITDIIDTVLLLAIVALCFYDKL